MFFAAKPNVTVGEKSRIEFYLQQLAETIGFERFRLPVLSRNTLLGLIQSEQNNEQIVAFLGEHLSHAIDAIRVQIDPQQAANCGSGGG